ncbi:MAG: caspase family protein, partial [Chloroflexota bacterium]
MPKRIACCIGINTYQNPKMNTLTYAASDAQTLATILRDQEFGAFDEVIEVLNEEATKQNILHQLKEILLNSDLSASDTVLVYFSGHGALDNSENFFLVPYDIDYLANDKIDPTTSVHITNIHQLLDNTDAGTVVVILDACHSGGSGKLLGRLEYDDGSNKIMIGAARFSELAWEAPELEHGRFTAYFFNALTQRPTLGQWITLQQAIAHVQAEMEKDMVLPEQTIELTCHTINHNIKLFKNPQYALNSEEFRNLVKQLCELSDFKIIDTQPEHSFPHAFIMRESRRWGRYEDMLVICLNNAVIDITPAELVQSKALYQKLMKQAGVTSCVIVTDREMPAYLKKILPRDTELRTISELKQALIDFEPYLKKLIREFEHGDPDRPGHPPLSEIYVEPNAYISYPRQRKSISEIIDEWLEDE